MYKVVYGFADLQDGNYIYSVGDSFPRDGGIPTPERVTELKGSNNKIGRPLIEEIEVNVEPVEPIADGEVEKKKTRKKQEN